MRRIHGMEVLETLEEIVNPRHTALLIIDVQNDWCSPEGKSGRLGRDLSMMPEMIAKLQALLEEARHQELLRVFVQLSVLPHGQSDSGPWMYRNTSKDLQANPEEDDFCMEGSWGQEVVSELQPLPGEIRVKKHRSSAFFQTDLDLILKNNGIKTVIVTGVATAGCVDAAVRDAQFRDFYAVVPRDCCAMGNRQQHEASLFISKAGVVTSDDLVRLWARLRAPVARV